MPRKMPEHSEGAKPSSANVRLVAVHLEDWPTAGGVAELSPTRSRTVLVGRNGAGKSLLLEGIFSGARSAGASAAMISRRGLEQPQSFSFDLEVPGQPSTVRFETKVTLSSEDLTSDLDLAKNIRRTEKCHLIDGGETLWSVDDGIAHLANRVNIPVSKGAGVLSFDSDVLKEKAPVAHKVQRFFHGVRRVEAGIPRQGMRRPELIAFQEDRPSPSYLAGRVPRLAYRIVRASLENAEIVKEFEQLCGRVGIGKSLKVKFLHGTDAKTTRKERWAMVTLDGVNIGLLADGTLRSAEILWMLLALRRGDLLVIEEPETGIHPGLLRRLLSVVDSYTIDHQILVSTHSIQVVNWATPDQIRLVARQGNNTVASSLSASQLAKLSNYLDEQGSLADFVYSGGADE